MIYIDANIFILALTGDDKRKKNCGDVLLDIVTRKIEACTSYLTWDEVTHIIKRQIGREMSILEGDRLLKFPNLKFIEVSGKVLFEAQKLISKYEIGPRDAIHAATAISLSVKEIISDDSDFEKIKEIKRTGVL